MNKDWRKNLAAVTNNVCRGCQECDGRACAGEVPGLGGAGSGATFLANYNSWLDIEVDFSEQKLPQLGVAPMTGVDNNMGGFSEEYLFQENLVKGALECGLFPCIGDGHPDYKLLDSAKALRTLGCKGVGFIKPYPNNAILERYSWIEDAIEMIGVDIDAYILATMAGKTTLEKKTATQLKALRKDLHHPFVLKGVFQEEDVELVQELRPDAIVISNHGGRVKDNERGIAYVLRDFLPRVKPFTGEVWVDGGLRSRASLLKAAALGAERVLIGRPFIQGVAACGEQGIATVMQSMYAE